MSNRVKQIGSVSTKDGKPTWIVVNAINDFVMVGEYKLSPEAVKNLVCFLESAAIFAKDPEWNNQMTPTADAAKDAIRRVCDMSRGIGGFKGNAKDHHGLSEPVQSQVGTPSEEPKSWRDREPLL